jgi:hypothetical protein
MINLLIDSFWGGLAVDPDKYTTETYIVHVLRCLNIRSES